MRAAYNHCLGLARAHYENFPVASRLVPRRLRGAVAAIYAFARGADDCADEGGRAAPERLACLDGYAARLQRIARGAALDDPVFLALSDAVERHGLPLAPFHDLLAAFRMDVTKNRYADFAEVLGYCRRSANPVGRLVLHLHGAADAARLRRSDAICTALQLINFLQDIGQDYAENDRIYLPQDEMARCAVSERHIAERRSDAAMRRLIELQIRRIRTLLDEGAPLAWEIGGRLGLELRATVCGAARMLDRLARQADLFGRPRLGARDWPVVAWRALGRWRPLAGAPGSPHA